MNRKLLAVPFALTVVVGSALGCTGSIGDADGSTTGPGGTPPGTNVSAACDANTDPGPSPIRRMTRVEYDNTVRDLLGDATAPAKSFPPEEQALGFDNNATALIVTSLLAEQYMNAAESLATAAVTRLDKIAPTCDAAKTEDACAKQFVQTFGKRALRRPLADDEVTKFLTVYTAGRTGGSYADGIKLVIEAMLQSPHFLYRVEFGSGAADAKTLPLTHYEMASRLSYFIWASMPDDSLLTAAETGALGTPDQVAAQARRMLKDPRARESVAYFHAQWLELNKLDEISKAGSVFPEYTPAIHDAMSTEVTTFVDQVFWSDGTIESLLTAPYTYANGALATWYGATAPSGSGFVKVPLDASKRAGIMTQGALLSLHAHANQTSPVHRGKFVRERLLCQPLPPPPADLVIIPPDPKPGSTTRDRFAQHDKDPKCGSCHHLMDPIGFGFENYDGVGRWRDKDATLPVDASGEVIDGGDANGKFVGAVALAKQLAASEQVHQCVVTQWFRYTYGRGETEADKCTMEALNKKYTEAKHDGRELMVALTQTPAFRFRRAVAP